MTRRAGSRVGSCSSRAQRAGSDARPRCVPRAKGPTSRRSGSMASRSTSLVEEVRAMGRRATSRTADVSRPRRDHRRDRRTGGRARSTSRRARKRRHPDPGYAIRDARSRRVEPCPRRQPHRRHAHLPRRAPPFRAGRRRCCSPPGRRPRCRPGVGLLPYVAAKAGVHAMVRSLALELAPQNIRVNVIAPGLTDTAMTRDVPGHVERVLEVGATRRARTGG